MLRSRRVPVALLTVALAIAGALSAPLTVWAGASCTATADALANGGFEEPVIGPATVELLDASAVPPWLTTDVINQIELWSDGFNGVPAIEGTQFAELNANSAGTLYQDVFTTPGSTMTWSLQHRARAGTDVMQVLIGDPAVADVLGDDGWDYRSPDISHTTDDWGPATDTYLVPAGQTCTRFAFRAVSTGSGDASVGNFLDAVGFDVSIPAGATPTPTPVVTPPPTDILPPATNDPAPSGSVVAVILAALFATAVAAGTAGRQGRRPRG